MALLWYLNSFRDAASLEALEHLRLDSPIDFKDFLSVIFELTPMKFVKSYFLATAALYSAWAPHADAQSGCPDFTTYSQVSYRFYQPYLMV